LRLVPVPTATRAAKAAAASEALASGRSLLQTLAIVGTKRLHGGFVSELGVNLEDLHLPTLAMLCGCLEHCLLTATVDAGTNAVTVKSTVATWFMKRCHQFYEAGRLLLQCDVDGDTDEIVWAATADVTAIRAALPAERVEKTEPQAKPALPTSDRLAQAAAAATAADDAVAARMQRLRQARAVNAAAGDEGAAGGGDEGAAGDGDSGDNSTGGAVAGASGRGGSSSSGRGGAGAAASGRGGAGAAASGRGGSTSGRGGAGAAASGRSGSNGAAAVHSSARAGSGGGEQEEEQEEEEHDVVRVVDRRSMSHLVGNVRPRDDRGIALTHGGTATLSNKRRQGDRNGGATHHTE